MQYLAKFSRKASAFFLLGALALAGLSADALAAAADPQTIVTTANTAFEAVTVLVVAVVSFYIIVKIVRGIKGR